MLQHKQTGDHHPWRMKDHARVRLAISAATAVLFAVVAQVAGASSPAPGPAASAQADDDDIERARLLGILEYTEVSLAFDDIPARDAFDDFRRITGIPIVARWNDDAVGFGLDPNTRISIDVAARPALDVLESMLEQCEVYEDCTWQLRKGFVEVGTKERLAVPAARDTRLYDIRSFMIEPPYFASDGNGDSTPSELKYAEAFTGKRMQLVRGAGGSVARKKPDELADEIVVLVVETIDPGKWDVGKEDYARKSDELTEPPAASSTAPATAAPATATPPKSQPRSVTGVGFWATLRVWRDQLVVKAPDFMHRQINGYPKAIMPEGGIRHVGATASTVNNRPAVAPPKGAHQSQAQTPETVTPARTPAMPQDADQALPDARNLTRPE